MLAHELAHDDLGHVAKAQALGVGLGIGMIILDQMFPGSGRITLIAGALVTSSYTLTWLVQTGGASGEGSLATHPGTQERIDALHQL